jgi:abhydrolase domain-containing protein 13
MNYFSNFLWTTLAGIGSILLMFYVFQNRLVYIPTQRTSFIAPEDFQLYNYEKLFFETQDKEQLQGWLFKASNYESAPTFLFFHGNAGNLSFRLPLIKGIIQFLRCNVFIISYRGYGLSTGTPSEIGLKMDAEAALMYLHSRNDIHSKKIIAFGRSLGGAVAINLAASYPEHVSAVIVENTFTSILDMIDCLFPLLSHFKFLSFNVWNSLATIQYFPSTLPTLFLSGEVDDLVPPKMMAQLYQSCSSEEKHMKKFPEGNHMDTYNLPNYYETMKKFLVVNNFL